MTWETAKSSMSVASPFTSVHEDLMIDVDSLFSPDIPQEGAYRLSAVLLVPTFAMLQML